MGLDSGLIDFNRKKISFQILYRKNSFSRTPGRPVVITNINEHCLRLDY